MRRYVTLLKVYFNRNTTFYVRRRSWMCQVSITITVKKLNQVGKNQPL